MCIAYSRGNEFERAQNVQDSYVESKKTLSCIYLALVVIENRRVAMIFIFKINTSKSLN